MNKNVPRKAGFKQVAVWRGVIVGADKVAEFEQFMLDNTGTRIQYLEEVTTRPGQGGPGGRNDVLFAIHDEDIPKFALRRFKFGDGSPAWIEDLFGNGHGCLYEERIAGYKTWDCGDGESQQRTADHIDGYDRDDLGESPDY